ncbi:MAG: glycosyltransferase [Planctomycetes bacterium]|nr:glycosyltransferase [Planctomycetota bacterium]
MPKVLYIGFGLSPFSKGGAINYQESIMEAVSAQGWDTTAFFVIPRYSLSQKPSLKTWRKSATKIIEIYNPPLAPAGYLVNPDIQCSEPAIEELTAQVLAQERPDIIHIHELQLHPASVIDLIAKSRIPVIKSMHNYYDLCPQRDLMFREKDICTDFHNGADCVECLANRPLSDSSYKNRLKWALAPIIPKPIINAYRLMKKAVAGKDTQGNALPQPHTNPYNAQQFLNRRRFFVEQLNKLDVVHCSTRRSAEIFNNYGVSKAKTRVISHSAKSIETITPKPLRHSNYPVVFGYLGGKWAHKGYNVLIEAFSKLDQSKAKLIIYHPGQPGRLSDKLNIELRRSYGPTPLNQMLHEIDVGLMPSIWEEMFGLVGVEFLTARLPVIGSRIGGIPDWLKDGENGFLAQPGDAQQLAAKMDLFIQNPALIAEMQKNIQPWKTIKAHTDEIIRLYQDILAHR